ncbi:MAG: prenyltransferase, partial [Acidimicrobiia bacterium]
APPLRLVHRGLGEGGVALGFGPVTTIGAYYVLARQFSWEAFYASLPVAILIALVLYVNEIPDREGDAAAGKRTLVVRWSKEAVVNSYLISVIACYALIVLGALGGLLPLPALAALLTLPMAVRVWKSLGRHYSSPYSLMPAMQMNIGLHLFTGLLLVAGYLLSIWL